MNQEKVTDPICGMEVDPASAFKAERDGQTFYFCSENCRQAFLGKLQPAYSDETSCCVGHEHHDDAHQCRDQKTAKRSPGAKYFCPMCPGVESDEPGDCPKCGMPLERNPAWVAPATNKTILYLPDAP